MRKWMMMGTRMAPECADIIRSAHDSMACWIALQLEWDEMPLATKIRIMKYSRWCLDQGSAVATAVECAFIEHVIDHEENWHLFKSCYNDDTIRSLMPLWKYNYREKAEEFMSRLLAAR